MDDAQKAEAAAKRANARRRGVSDSDDPDLGASDAGASGLRAAGTGASGPGAGGSRTTGQWVGLFAGAAVFFSMMLAPAPEGLSREAWITAALAALMVAWWISEALPIAATSLLPLAVLPLAGVASMREAAAPYMSPIVVLLMAGFIIAKGIERWNLHERIALTIVDSIGARPPALIAGFMIAAALLSMWISNTATALMMTPIALSVAHAVLGPAAMQSRFAVALLLAVAYACSIGGLGTPVGSPTNLIVIGYLAEQGVAVGFSDWMRFGLPAVLTILPLAWLVLVRYGARDAGADMAAAGRVVREARAALGPATAPEIRTLIVFALIAGAWIFRAQLQHAPGLERLNDQIIAVAGAIVFFILPSGSKAEPGAPLLDWASAERIPWGVVLLFGGGLSLASAIAKTGLAAFLAAGFSKLGGAPDIVMILALTALVLALTEVISNVATVSAIMPMVAAIAIAAGAALLQLSAAVGLAASCAFMLPMATGPNAVAYASGALSVGRMARIGVRVNLIAVAAITVLVAVLGPRIG